MGAHTPGVTLSALHDFVESLIENRCDCNWPDEGEDGVMECVSCQARYVLKRNPHPMHSLRLQKMHEQEARTAIAKAVGK